jgi:DNA repair protein RadC
MITKSYTLTVKEGRDPNFETVKIDSPQAAADYIRQFYHEDIAIYESFFLLMVNQQNETIAYAKISQGGVTGTVVDPKIIAKYAVDCLSSGVILAHNHPSGTLYPSDADRQLTDKVKKGLSLFDIKVLDHVILTPNGKYYSFANNGQL